MPKRILVTGTFDLLHEAHIKFLREARKYGDELYVLLASDQVVLRNKGRMPVQVEQERSKVLKGLEFVTDVAIGNDLEGIDDAVSLRPDIVVLGFDQYTRHSQRLEDYCLRNSLEFHRLSDQGDGTHTTDLIQQADNIKLT